MTRNPFAAFITGLLFAVLSTSLQSIAWFAATFQTIPSFIFILLSLHATALYINSKKQRYFWLSLVGSIAAFLFKESGGIALVLNPVLYILFSKPKPRIGYFIKRYGIFLFYIGFITCVRYISVIAAPQYNSSTFLGASPSGYQKILLNSFLYPYVSLSQIFLPQKIVSGAASVFQNMYYQCCLSGTNALAMAENITSDLLSSFFSMVLVSIILIAYMKSNRKAVFQFLIIFYLCSYFPHINIVRGSAYLDSRYMYVSSAIGSSILVYSLIELIFSIKNRLNRLSMMSAATLCVIIIMLIHIKVDRNTIRVFVYESKERISILEQIKQLMPQLPVKPVFYIGTNNKNGYYGIADIPLPFQQGIGHTLMVWYADDGRVPKSLLTSDFLWGIKDQGYTESQGSGFGYYRDMQELYRAITLKQIKKEQIIGLYYDTDHKKMLNITDSIINKYY